MDEDQYFSSVLNRHLDNLDAIYCEVCEKSWNENSIRETKQGWLCPECFNEILL